VPLIVVDREVHGRRCSVDPYTCATDATNPGFRRSRIPHTLMADDDIFEVFPESEKDCDRIAKK
jgi:hypothetical protein